MLTYNKIKFIPKILWFLVMVFILTEVGIRILPDRLWDVSKMQPSLAETTVFATQKGNTNSAKISHPYFGFVYDSKKNSNINSAGFKSQYEFPFSKKESQFVIGIFGGSVALSLAEYILNDPKQNFVTTLKKRIPQLKDKEIIILNFAVAAYKQPQQFYVASQYASSIDLSLNLDGFNEIYLPSPGSQFPYHFPYFSYVFFSKNPHSANTIKKMTSLFLFDKKIEQIRSDFPFLNNSYTFRAISSVAHKILRRNILKIENALRKPTPVDSLHTKEMVTTRAKDWAKYTKFQNAILKSEQSAALFFIQPNQHNISSKPLSSEESKLYFNKNYPQFIVPGYQALLKEYQNLKQLGIEIVDLSQVFLKTKQTVYRDNCCHVNHIGNKILEEEIINKLQMKWPNLFSH